MNSDKAQGEMIDKDVLAQIKNSHLESTIKSGILPACQPLS